MTATLDERPTIRITNDIAHVVDQAERALGQLNRIYVRSRLLVQVVRDSTVVQARTESHGLDYPEGQPIIVAIGRDRLRELCGVAAAWERTRIVKGEPIVELTQPPPWVPATLMDRGEWKMPSLNGISDAPVFRADGTIHDQPGYDPHTRMIYDPGSTVWPAIQETPSRQDATAALAELVEPLRDFAVVADHDRAAAAALILTLLARQAIGGPVPGWVVRATAPGSGKGLLLDTCAMVATGRAAPKRAPATSDEELRKALLAYALEAPAMITIDNVDGTFGSPMLAMVLTAGSITDRMLGVSETRTVPIGYVITATGNNLRLRGDLGRRIIPIDLDPKCEYPEDRGGWRYPNLIEHVQRERPRLVAAALTVLRAYFVAGRPGHGKPALGSYEAWDALVRGAIVWAGVHDPLKGLERIRATGDEDKQKLGSLLGAWREVFGPAGATVAEAIAHAPSCPELRSAMGAYCRSDDEISAKSIGKTISNANGRICRGLLFYERGEVRGSKRWAVRLESETPEPSAPAQLGFG